MPTEQQLMTALRNADSAGDNAAAARFAQMIKEQRTASQDGPAEAAPEPGMSTMEALKGGADILGAGVYGAGEDVISGLSGLAAPLGEQAATVEAVQEAIPDYQMGEDAQKLVGVLSEKYKEHAPEIVKDVMTALQTGGQQVFERGMGTAKRLEEQGMPGMAEATKTGAAVFGAATEALPEAAALIPATAAGRAAVKGIASDIGGATKKAADFTSDAAKYVADDIAKSSVQLQRMSPAKAKIAELLESGAVDKRTAGFMLTDTGKLVKNKAEREAMKQGFSDRAVASIKQGSAADKARSRKMVNITERVTRDPDFAIENRPGDVVGESFLDRFKAVKRINKTAGQKVDKASRGLEGKTVDVNPTKDNFISSMNEIGVKVGDDLNPDFRGSSIEYNPADKKVITNVIQRVKRLSKSGDAKEAHDLKKLIDNQVTYGKAESLVGDSERILRGVRESIDDTLDGKFKAYDRANQSYSDTISAINEFKDVSGAKMNLAGPNSDKAVGILLRRLTSNAQSRTPLMSAMSALDEVANKYGIKFKDNILKQVVLADELEGVFKIPPPTALKGQVGQAITSAITESKVQQTAKGLGKVVEKVVGGPSEEAAFTAIKEILK